MTKRNGLMVGVAVILSVIVVGFVPWSTPESANSESVPVLTEEQSRPGNHNPHFPRIRFRSADMRLWLEKTPIFITNIQRTKKRQKSGEKKPGEMLNARRRNFLFTKIKARSYEGAGRGVLNVSSLTPPNFFMTTSHTSSSEMVDIAL